MPVLFVIVANLDINYDLCASVIRKSQDHPYLYSVRGLGGRASKLLKDLIRGSFVPSSIVQRMRQYNRRIFDLNKEIVYKLTKLDAVLRRYNIRISNYVSCVDSKSYKEVVRFISEGITDASQLASVIHGRTINHVGKETIIASLMGVISEVGVDL